MEAYEEAINETSKEHAPWFVVPADKKMVFARLTSFTNHYRCFRRYESEIS